MRGAITMELAELQNMLGVKALKDRDVSMPMTSREIGDKIKPQMLKLVDEDGLSRSEACRVLGISLSRGHYYYNKAKGTRKEYDYIK